MLVKGATGDDDVWRPPFTLTVTQLEKSKYVTDTFTTANSDHNAYKKYIAKEFNITCYTYWQRHFPIMYEIVWTHKQFPIYVQKNGWQFHLNLRHGMMTSSNGNIFRVNGHLCGEFTGDRWIPRTKASDAELWCFLWSAPEQTVE